MRAWRIVFSYWMGPGYRMDTEDVMATTLEEALDAFHTIALERFGVGKFHTVSIEPCDFTMVKPT